MSATAYNHEIPIQTATAYNNAIGYLRAVLVVMVVAHHAALAYHPYAPPINATLAMDPRWWQAFPIVDAQRWSGALLLVGFNDIFFMSLMFFLSGLFVWPGLKAKGAASFLRDRALRLGRDRAQGAGLDRVAAQHAPASSLMLSPRAAGATHVAEK